MIRNNNGNVVKCHGYVRVVQTQRRILYDQGPLVKWRNLTKISLYKTQWLMCMQSPLGIHSITHFDA